MSIKTTILIFRLIAVLLWCASIILGGILWLARNQADTAMILYVAIMLCGVVFGVIIWRRIIYWTGFTYKGEWCSVAYSWEHKQFYGMACGEYYEHPNENQLKDMLKLTVEQHI